MEHMVKLPDQTTYHANHLQAYFNLDDVMIFDIETTGLSPKNTHVILIGFIVFNQGQTEVHQLLAEHVNEEKELLKDFESYLKNKKVLINFNGSTFDIPYLNKRYLHHLAYKPIHPNQSFDLYRLCKKAKLPVANYRLKSLEEYLGIFREDTISGKESIALYFNYMRDNDLKAKRTVLLHNYEDILHLILFLKILDQLPETLVKSQMPRWIQAIDTTYYLSQHKIKGDFLNLHWQTNHKQSAIHHFCQHEPMDLTIDESSIQLRFPIFQLIIADYGTYTFIDPDPLPYYKDFNHLSDQEKHMLLLKHEEDLFYDLFEKITNEALETFAGI